MEWMVRVGEKEYQAKSLDELKRWFETKFISPADYVYHPVLERWMYARELEELQPLMPQQQLAPSWHPGVAGVLSLVIPGAGQIYRGQTLNGLLWLLFVVLGYYCFFVPGLILHLFCVVLAASGK